MVKAMFKQFNNMMMPLMAPDADGKSGVVAEERTADDIFKFLNEDDEDEPLKLDEKKETKKEAKDDKEAKEDDKEDIEEDEDDVEDEETDELKELEDELEEPDEEKLELSTPVPRREILKKYPSLFKDFPYLEKSYWREREYTKIFPTIDEAKEAIDKSQTLEKYEADLNDGNIEMALKVIKNGDPNKFNKLIDNYLDVLGNVDKDAKIHIYGDVIKKTIMSMVSEGRKSNNEALQNAAHILNQYVFASSEFTPPTKLAGEDKKDNTEALKLKSEREEFLQQQLDTAKNGLDERIDKSIKSTIDANIDTKNSMTPYIKKAAITQAYEDVIRLMDKDDRFKTIIDKYWELAIKNNFKKEYTEKIRSAYLSKAQTLLPSVIKKARNEAMRGIRVKNDEDDSKESASSERRSAPNHERNNERKRKPGSLRELKPGESAMEYLMAED